MKILILTIGKCKKDYIKTGIKDYESRLGYYFPIELRSIKEEKIGIKRNIKEILEYEAIHLLKHIKRDAIVITLEIKGKAISSEQLAKQIQTWQNQSKKQLVFVIGGALGLGKKIIERSNFHLSLSSMTFPHELSLLILLEQLYRAGTIIRGEAYHK